MKKYVIYGLIAEYGEVNEEFYNYREAFKKYQKSDIPKTLYGINEQGDVSVIYSRG